MADPPSPGDFLRAPSGDFDGDGAVTVGDGLAAMYLVNADWFHPFVNPSANECQSDADCEAIQCTGTGVGCVCRPSGAFHVCFPAVVGPQATFGRADTGACACGSTSDCLNGVSRHDLDLNCDGSFDYDDLAVVLWLVGWGPGSGPGSHDFDGDGVLDGCDDDDDNDGVVNSLDCGPHNGSVFPGSEGEICGNGLDDDCNGVGDEECAEGCVPDCYNPAFHGGDGCGGVCERCLPADRAISGTCLPREIFDLPTIGELGRIPHVSLSVPPNRIVDVRIQSAVDATDEFPVAAWVTAGSIDGAFVTASCAPHTQTEPVESFVLGIDRVVVASALSRAGGEPQLRFQAPPGQPRPYDLIVASPDRYMLGHTVAVTVRIGSVDSQTGLPLPPNSASAELTSIVTLGAALVGPLDARRGDAIFIGAVRHSPSQDGEASRWVEMAYLSAPAGDGPNGQCQDAHAFDACLGCGAISLRSANPDDPTADESALGNLVRLIAPVSAGARRHCGVPTLMGVRSHAGMLLVGASDVTVSPDAASTQLRAIWTRRRAPDTAAESQLIEQRGEIPGEWHPGDTDDWQIQDRDGDGLTYQTELALGTCDDDQGPANDGLLGGRSCKGMRELVNSYAPWLRVTDCPSISPVTFVSCDDVPATCPTPPECWSAADSDNDGLDDLAEVFGVVTASNKDPRFRPNLFNAGPVVRRGLFAPPRGPADVVDWRLDVSRMAPVSPTRYDVLVEVEGDVPTTQTAANHDHRLSGATTAAFKHPFEAEGLECAYEPAVCHSPYDASLDPPCCGLSEPTQLHLHVFEQRRWFADFGNHANHTWPFHHFTARAKFMAGGLDQSALQRGERTFGLEPERRFTRTFRYVELRSEGVLKRAGNPFSGGLTDGRVIDYANAYAESQFDDFVLPHEMGHSLGLGHVGYHETFNPLAENQGTRAGGSANPVYPSLMNGPAANGFPAKSSQPCLDASCTCDGAPRFSRGLLPGLDLDNLPWYLSDSTYSNGLRYAEWLRCTSLFVLACQSGADCAASLASNSCTCDLLEPTCNCDPQELSCAVDFARCVAPDYTIHCDGKPCPAITEIFGSHYIHADFDDWMKWIDPPEWQHGISDDNDWLRMYATGRASLRQTSFAEYTVSTLPFNYP